MDLGSFKKKDTTEVELRLPNQTLITHDDGVPMTITVYGVYSDKYRDALDAQQTIRIKRAQASGGKMTLTPEELRADRFSFVVSMVQSWNITLDGEKPECSQRTVRDLFERLPFVYDAVNSNIEDGQSFLETQSKT